MNINLKTLFRKIVKYICLLFKVPFVGVRLPVTTEWRQPILVGHIPTTQYIQTHPALDHIHTFLENNLFGIT